MTPLRIAFVTAELAPFAKTGGLADVSAALPRWLHRQGHQVRLFLPFYARIDQAQQAFEADARLRGAPVDLAGRRWHYDLVRGYLPGSDLEVSFIHCPELYARPGIYTSDPDEHLRFLLLTRAALDLCQLEGFAPDIVHAQDWQTALAPIYLKTRYAWDQRIFGATRTLLTIHNLGYQGRFAAASLADTGLQDSAHLFHQDHLKQGWWSFLETGILHADAVSTVSPTYAREIQTAEQGFGLDGLLRERSASLFGILNGVDYNEWGPECDRFIPVHYDADSLEKKAHNCRALLEAVGLGYQPGVPVFGIVSRLAGQKGVELVIEVMPELLSVADVRFVALGSGDPGLEAGLAGIQRAFPGKAVFYSGFNNRLAHLVEAGSDFFLMPSYYEPCGLNQLYSLKYGTVPIVRRTGGLADSVELWNPETGEGTGFPFEHYDAGGLRWAIRQGLAAFADPRAWRRLQRNGMSRDYSWDAQGARYVELYRRLTGKH